MTKSTWRGEDDVGSNPKGREQVEEKQELRGNYHINQSLSVDHLERAFAEVSLTEKYDCKKVVMDISAHDCLKKTNHKGRSPSETSDVKDGPQMEDPQKKQEDGTEVKCNTKDDLKKDGEIKGEIGEQEEYGRDLNKNEEKRLLATPQNDGDDNEDESSDEEDQEPLITVKLEGISKDKTEALGLNQDPNKTRSVHIPYSPVTPKILLQDSSAHQPLKEAYQKEKASLQSSEEVRHGPQKKTEEKEDVTVERDNVEEGDKVGLINKREKDGKFVFKKEGKDFPSAVEDEGGDDEESGDEVDQVPLITVKLGEEVRDDTDEAYLERGPSKGGSIHMRYSPMTPKSHGLSIHGSHGLHPHTSSNAAAGLYPSSHMSSSPRYDISAGPYNSAVTSTYQSAGSSGCLAGLPPLFENTTMSPASYANVSPQREGTTTLPLGSYANNAPLYESTSTMSPGSYTIASSLYEGTPALSPGSYASASPHYEGTSTVSPGSYTSTSPLYEGASAVSPGSYKSTSPLYENTCVSPGSYTSASPLYEGTPAMSQGSCASASPLYEGICAVSPVSYTSASPLYEGTTAQSPSFYRSTSPSYDGIGKTGPQTNLFIEGSVAVTPAPAFVHTSGGPLSPPASDTSSLHDDLEAHTDSLTNYASINNCGGHLGEHFPEIPTPYMTPPHQAVQPIQVYSHAFGQHNSIEEVLEVITQVDVGGVEPDVGEVEPHHVDQLLKDLETVNGEEFEGVPIDINFEAYSGENQSPYPGGLRINHPYVGKRNNGYTDIKLKTQPKVLSIPQQEIQRHTCKSSLEQIFRKMTRIGIDNTPALYRVGNDGETCLTRILKQSSGSENFYENIYAHQEILKRIQMCCDMPVDSKYKRCSKCGQGNAEEFFTPLSICNMEGKCGLTIAVEKNHPPEVVNYLCSGIEECHKDLQRAFNQQARQIFALNITSYPVFGRFLSNL